MAKLNKSIIIPNLDTKFIRDRNYDNNWIISKFSENVSLLNELANNLPKELEWDYQTAETFKAKAALMRGDNGELEKLRFWWADMTGQIQAFGLTSAWRLIEITSASIWALRRNDPICAAVMARTALETVASYAWFVTKVRPAIEEIVNNYDGGFVSGLEEELLKTLFASKASVKFYDPTNIVTIINHIAGKVPDHEDVGGCYAALCEVAHPNMLGRSIYLKRKGDVTVISRDKGPSTVVVERNALIALSWAAGTLPRSLTIMQDTCRKVLQQHQVTFASNKKP